MRYELRAARHELKPGVGERLLRSRRPKYAAGFTLIEMVVVISMVLVLLAIALPMYNQSIIRAREATFSENLHTLNRVINQYSLDKKRAPQALDDLIQAGYLKYIPNDITGKADTWKLDSEDPQNAMDANQPGIASVHSGSEATASDGRAYSSWQ
jgi:general secretion pathway protein G